MRREVWECEVQFRFVYYEEIKRQAKRIQIIVYECRCNESRRLKAKSEVGIYTPRIHWLGISWGESTYWRGTVCQSKIDFVELGLVSMVQNDNGCMRERKSPRIVISTPIWRESVSITVLNLIFKMITNQQTEDHTNKRPVDRGSYKYY